MIDSNNKLIIAGDMFPYDDNSQLFEEGKAKEIFGEKIYRMFAEATFSIANLEGALTESKTRQHKVGPVIKASPKAVNGLKDLGIKAVALANNHVTDYGQQGVADTIKALDEAGIMHIGAGVDNHADYLSIALGDKKVCVYNVSETFFNTSFVNLYDEYLVCKEIGELKAKHDYVIVMYHGGSENYPYPTPLLRKRFHRMADNGADFITAQHTHCIGCEERYNGSYLLYGQGNFLFSRMAIKTHRQGLVLELDFSGAEVVIRQHLVDVKQNGCLDYSENQDLTGFYERSKSLNDEGFVLANYKNYIANNKKLRTDYLQAYRGNTVESSFMNKVFPKYYRKKMEKKYSEEQLLRILLSLQSDRTGENVLYMWRDVIEKNCNQK